jgi:hypothetical protein
LIAEAVSCLNIPSIEKLMQHIKDGAGSYDYYQRAVLLYLQRGHHYGIHYGTHSLGFLQDILDGSPERVGNTDDIYHNEYCDRVSGIIKFEDDSIWNKLNKSLWTDAMFNCFYYVACVSLNAHVVREIEKFESDNHRDCKDQRISINRNRKVLKLVQFGHLELVQYSSLQKLIDRIKQNNHHNDDRDDDRENIERIQIKNLEEYLWGVIISSHKDSFELIDLYINNFGFNSSLEISLSHQISSVKNVAKYYLPSTKDKNFQFHLIKRGLFQHFKNFEEHSLTFVGYLHGHLNRDIEQVIQDICFLIVHGFTDFKNLQRFFYYSGVFGGVGDGLVILFVRLHEMMKETRTKIVMEEIFTLGEIREIEQQLQGRKLLLDRHLLPELVSIVLFYVF